MDRLSVNTRSDCRQAAQIQETSDGSKLLAGGQDRSRRLDVPGKKIPPTLRPRDAGNVNDTVALI